MNTSPQKKLSFGPFLVDLNTQELWKGSTRLKIGGQPFGILALLLERPGELISREELRKQIWSGDTFVDFNQGLNAAVNKLRDCLSDSADEPRYIETLPRRGYRFIAEVAPAPNSTVAPEIPLPPITPNASLEPSREIYSPSAPLIPIWPQPTPSFTLEKPFPPDTAKLPYRWLTFAALFILFSVMAIWIVSLHRFRNASPATEATILGGTQRAAVEPAFSSDGQFIAYKSLGDSPQLSVHYVPKLGHEGDTKISGNSADCCPTWSPDGQSIAFSRIQNGRREIYTVTSSGGAPRLLLSVPTKTEFAQLDWSPDGKSIAFTGDTAESAARIMVLSLNDLSVLALTSGTGGHLDWGPAYSPDGHQFAFVRGQIGSPNAEIFLMPAVGGEARQLTTANAPVRDAPVWTSDGSRIVYSLNRNGDTRLWQIPVTGGTPEMISGAGSPSWHPTISRKSGELAYQHILGASSIWRMDLDSLTPKDIRMVVISPTGKDEGPQLSPNGRKLAFMSNPSNSMEIWISDPDGSYPVRLTNLDGCGSPRWSPDSGSIAFDSVHTGRPSVYVVDMSGGEPRLLVGSEGENVVPSWSHDGKWIYFASNRTGQDQVWKIPANGGQPIQITKQGGFAALESPDGKFLYYAKTRTERPEIWQVPIDGGTESLLSSLVRPGIWAKWSVAAGGIFFIDNATEPYLALQYYDLQSGKVQVVKVLERDSFWLFATEDGRSVWYSPPGEEESTIMLQKSFH
jgi:Tol biopolymer transport system component/DNA-binding winged helix-turn-helix (wHTH) protein